jgi:hypothetical protein
MNEEFNQEEVFDKQEIIVPKPIDTLYEEDKSAVITKYINPQMNCTCCNLPNIAIKINKAYLSGKTYKQIVEEFSESVEKETGNKLQLSEVSEHFSSHFDFTGAAIAEFNRKMGMNQLPVVEQKEMKDIFSVLTGKRVNDLELLELSMKEQIKRLNELEDIKKDRIKENRLHNIENIIMKQEMIVNNLQMNTISKLKTWSKAMLQSKQAEYLDRQLQFLDPETASFLGVENNTINPSLYKEAEKIYIKTVIENVVKRIKIAVDISLQIDIHQKSHFYKEFQKQLTGIEKDINENYETKIKELKNIKGI